MFVAVFIIIFSTIAFECTIQQSVGRTVGELYYFAGRFIGPNPTDDKSVAFASNLHCIAMEYRLSITFLAWHGAIVSVSMVAWWGFVEFGFDQWGLIFSFTAASVAIKRFSASMAVVGVYSFEHTTQAAFARYCF